MSRFFIDHHCNGHTARDREGVELDSIEQAGSYALAAAPQLFKDLIPGERRECALAVTDESQGWRLNINLTLCLEVRSGTQKRMLSTPDCWASSLRAETWPVPLPLFCQIETGVLLVC